MMETVCTTETSATLPTTRYNDPRTELTSIINRSLTLFIVASTLEQWTSVKRFVSLQFLNPNTDGTTPWTGDEPVARPLPTYDNTNTE
jgi:hypothetical protein